MNIQFIRHIISEFVIGIFLSFVQIIHTHYALICGELESRVQKGISDLSSQSRAENCMAVQDTPMTNSEI